MKRDLIGKRVRTSWLAPDRNTWQRVPFGRGVGGTIIHQWEDGDVEVQVDESDLDVAAIGTFHPGDEGVGWELEEGDDA